jgi:hypothetical protein
MLGEQTVYRNVVTVASQEPSDHLAYTEEFLNGLMPAEMPPHKLKVNVGGIIMPLQNLT